MAPVFNLRSFAAVGASFAIDRELPRRGGSLKLTGPPRDSPPIDFMSRPVLFKSLPPVFSKPPSLVDMRLGFLGLGLPARLGELWPQLCDLTAERSLLISKESNDLGRFSAYSAASLRSSTLYNSLARHSLTIS